MQVLSCPPQDSRLLGDPITLFEMALTYFHCWKLQQCSMMLTHHLHRFPHHPLSSFVLILNAHVHVRLAKYTQALE